MDLVPPSHDIAYGTARSSPNPASPALASEHDEWARLGAFGRRGDAGGLGKITRQGDARKLGELDAVVETLRGFREELVKREQQLGEREQALDQKEQEKKETLARLKEEVQRRKDINDRKQRQLDDADSFLGMRLASDKAIMDRFSELFDRVSTWSQRYNGAGTPKYRPNESGIDDLWRRFFHSESEEEILAILNDTTKRQLFARDLVVRFLCLYVFRSFGLEDAPVESGQDYWLEKEGRMGFSTLEACIYKKGQYSPARMRCVCLGSAYQADSIEVCHAQGWRDTQGVQ